MHKYINTVRRLTDEVSAVTETAAEPMHVFLPSEPPLEFTLPRFNSLEGESMILRGDMRIPRWSPEQPLEEED